MRHIYQKTLLNSEKSFLFELSLVVGQLTDAFHWFSAGRCGVQDGSAQRGTFKIEYVTEPHLYRLLSQLDLDAIRMYKELFPDCVHTEWEFVFQLVFQKVSKGVNTIACGSIFDEPGNKDNNQLRKMRTKLLSNVQTIDSRHVNIEKGYLNRGEVSLQEIPGGCKTNNITCPVPVCTLLEDQVIQIVQEGIVIITE